MNEHKEKTGMEYFKEPDAPLTFAIAEAKVAIISAMNQMKRAYGLPYFIWEGIFAEIQTEVLTNEKAEMLSDFRTYKEDFRKSYFKKDNTDEKKDED